MSDGFPAQSPHDPQGPNEEGVRTNVEIRAALQAFTLLMNVQIQVVTTQSKSLNTQTKQDVGPKVNTNVSPMASRLREFTRMSPPMFFCSKVNEDLKSF